MNPEMAVDIFKTVVVFALYIVAPFLAITLVVGLITSLIQSVTSIQEQTLTFAPKLIATSGLMILLAPWLLRTLTEFTAEMISRIGGLGQ
ncbi:flagellar biosynthetic protein FliQ [Rariglobus hedericola]|uniref:Flagellar biosynthetic protein FliQ n=1 Tax=Rariglobus hedericola TaxID=2597822 RepID=A0A556QPR7_9BACT|nr:flagellar biosynthetic protein FliQ [Rariglobus hedericola]TSJ78644.1 flagellar biosynthetic protein FliQ [Rariglobus hedericola]